MLMSQQPYYFCCNLFSAAFQVWTAKQFENDNVDEEHFMRFPDENAVFKAIRLSVDVALMT